MSNEEKSFQKTNINCLPCIYTVHKGKPYKIGLLANEILQDLLKKKEK